MSCWLFALCILFSACKNRHLYHIVTQTLNYPLKEDSTVQDQHIAELLNYYRDSIKLKMKQPLLYTKRPLSKALPESTLGNWVCDATLRQINRQQRRPVDALLIDYFCLKKDLLTAGAITLGDLYELLPDKQDIILASLSGKDLQSICDSIAKINGMPLSGIRMKIRGGRATEIKIGTDSVHLQRVYTLACNRDLIKRRFFAQLLKDKVLNDTHMELRKLLLEEMNSTGENKQTIDIHLDQRITYAE